MTHKCSSCLLAVVLLAACTSAPPAVRTPRDVPPELSDIDAAWFRRTFESRRFQDYLRMPVGSVHLQRFPRRTLISFAMVESFLRHANWHRIWHVAELRPDEFSGVAILNFLVVYKPDNFVSCYLEKIDPDLDAMGVEAAMFAHIRDQPSRPHPLWILVGDLAGYHENAYLTCAEWAAGRNSGYMSGEWSRLSGFVRNTNIRRLATRCLEVSSSPEGSEQFSLLVGQVRELQERFLGCPLFDRSVHEVAGDRNEVREFEIRFFGKHESLNVNVFWMTGIRPKYVNHEVHVFFRVPKWPHIVSMEGGSRYLDKIGELFALLEKGEPGEVRMEYSTFLIVSGEYSRALEDALPPHSHLGCVPGNELLVARVLNENLESARAVFARHAPGPIR